MKARDETAGAERIAIERARIDFLVRRDGIAAAEQWVWRTARIYRRAVLSPHHFASRDEYRRKFIRSYCAFKAWLARVAGAPQAAGAAASNE